MEKERASRRGRGGDGGGRAARGGRHVRRVGVGGRQLEGSTESDVVGRCMGGEHGCIGMVLTYYPGTQCCLLFTPNQNLGQIPHSHPNFYHLPPLLQPANTCNQATAQFLPSFSYRVPLFQR